MLEGFSPGFTYAQQAKGRPGPSDDDYGDAGAQFFLSGFFPSGEG